jgi:hypothetical protein
MINISNPPACLIDYIVLKDGCYCNEAGAKIATPIPASGFYIESLQGLSIENLSDITPENIGTTDFLNSLVYFASAIVEKQLTAYLSGKGFDLNKRGESYSFCSAKSTYSLPVAFDKGVRVSRANLHSPQARIFVEAIKVKAKTSGTTTVKIEDSLGNVLWSQSIPVVVDQIQTIAVNLAFEPEILFILVDSTTIALYDWDCIGSTSCCGKAAQMRTDLSIMGFDGIQLSYVGFLGVCVRLDCTDENIICNFLNRLQMAILYQTGAEILKEWVSPSSRVNLIKTGGKEWAVEMIPIWEAQSQEYLAAEFRNIENLLSQDNYCYQCQNNLRSIPVLPS